MKHSLLLIVVLAISMLGNAQLVLTIKDAETKLVLPFSTVECMQKQWGKYSDSAGRIEIPDSIWQSGNVTITYVGYDSLSLQFPLTQKLVYLRKVPAALQDVTIRNCKSKEVKKLQLRNKSDHHYFGYTVKSDGFMWAAFVANSYNKPAIAEKISFGVGNLFRVARADAPVRLRFFEKDTISNKPGEEIGHDVIEITPNKFGWITTDISSYKIRIPPEGMIVAFEMFDAGSQYHFTYTHNMSDGSKKEIEHYGWMLEGVRGKEVELFTKHPGGAWRSKENSHATSSASPAVGLTISVCKD